MRKHQQYLIQPPSRKEFIEEISRRWSNYQRLETKHRDIRAISYQRHGWKQPQEILDELNRLKFRIKQAHKHYYEYYYRMRDFYNYRYGELHQLLRDLDRTNKWGLWYQRPTVESEQK